MDILEFNTIDVDLKENYFLGTDLECHQNDTLILNFKITNYGVPVDLTKFNVKLNIKKPDGTDYIQSKNGIVKNADGTLKITTEDGFTNFGGNAKGEVVIWNSALNQKTSRLLYIRIIPSVLITDGKVHESTLTALNYLDFALNKATEDLDKLDASVKNAEEEIKKIDGKIEEANQTKNNLDKSNTTALTTNTTLNQSITTANDKITNLDTRNNTASENIKNLDSKNNTASENIKNLDTRNATASENIKNLDTRNNTASENIKNLDTRNNTATNNINTLNETINRGNQLKKDLDVSINNGNTIKPKLDEANKLAQQNIEKIQELDTTNIIQDVGSIKKEISDARGSYGTLNQRITEAENSGGIMLGETLPEIKDRKPKILYLQILK